MSRITSSFSFVMFDISIDITNGQKHISRRYSKHKSTFFGKYLFKFRKVDKHKRNRRKKIKFQLKSNQFIKTFFLCKIDTESIFVQSKFCLASKHNYGHKNAYTNIVSIIQLLLIPSKITEKMIWK